MAQPVEIDRKKTRLLWLAVVGIGLTVWQVWGNYDDLMSFTWKAIPNLLFAAIPAFSGLVALALLLHSLFCHEPYLLVYDDRIEIDRPMNKNFWVLHFSDVKDLTTEGDGDKKKAVFELQPFLKKSDLPKRKVFQNANYTIKLGALDRTSDEAYDLILDRFLAYKKKNQQFNN